MWSRQGQRSKPAQMPRPGWKSIPGERSEVKDQGQGGKAKSGSWLSNRSMPAGLGEVRVKAWLSRLFWGQGQGQGHCKVDNGLSLSGLRPLPLASPTFASDFWFLPKPCFASSIHPWTFWPSPLDPFSSCVVVVFCSWWPVRPAWPLVYGLIMPHAFFADFSRQPLLCHATFVFPPLLHTYSFSFAAMVFH